MKKFLIFVLFIVMGIMNTTYARAESETLMKGEKDGVMVEFIHAPETDYPHWIRIDNQGSFSIRFNSLADEFYQISSSGKHYLMKVEKRYGGSDLNPGEVALMSCYEYMKPSSSIKKMLVILNYGKLKIELTPVD